MIQYPAGQGPQSHQKHVKTKASAMKQSKTIYGSRGMTLEERLNQSNEYYLSRNIAVIHKKPTPIQVVKVDYPKRAAARITEAYYRHASTTDYNGIYQGYYVDFEAKETKNKSGFPLSNLPQHQQEHMAACLEAGGLVFVIISFTAYNEIYLLPYQMIKAFQEDSNKQSVPYKYIKEHGYVCPSAYQPTINYLSALDEFIKDNHIELKGV
ncbi:Holliday junction resolvase RecU [Eremococcus coleocola]|uniref:Holliday junction resolvase RecU n=1 Tax=Eremococcus coleocola ACS-139-V-Col8 TaxID=908337 RepID=E4KLU3_9LACT|nr:Holliday junction resolvase RecU [Eremococcus coleocola]EFR32124.1 recombination protein U [Eremococcus coleocola ACS-139-V-Col8]